MIRTRVQILTLVTLLLFALVFGLLRLLPTNAQDTLAVAQETTSVAADTFEASYVWLSREDMIAQADAIFVGRVVRFSQARWNQDSGEYWQGVGANLPYHEITVTVEQPLVDGIGLGDEATITVLGGSPAGSIRSGNIVIADTPDYTLHVGDQVVFFVRATDLAWRPGPDMQEASRHVTMFMGAPSMGYLTRGEDGLYHSQDPQEPPMDLDALIAKIETSRQ